MKKITRDRLKVVRKSCGLTLEEVGRHINVSKQTLNKYESGIVKNIPLEKIEAIAKLYGVSPSYIMGWEDENDNLLDSRENYIKNRISQKMMSIKSFAESTDIPYTTLHSMLERGIGKASFDTVIKVCKALGITVDDLEQMSEHSQTLTIETITAHAVGDLSEESIKKIIEYAKLIKLQEKLEGKDKE